MILKATKDDIGALFDAHVAALTTDPKAYGIDEVEWKRTFCRNFDRYFDSNSNCMYFLHKVDGEIQGMVCLDVPDDPRLKHVVVIKWFWVSASCRGAGLGSMLIDKVMEYAQSIEGVEKIKLFVVESQERAIALYHSRGFESVGTLHKFLKVQGCYLDYIVMEKELGR